jgi:adenylate cyclase
MAKDRLSGKLAVILHADVAGSTQLVQQNERLAHERIQDAFRRFSGTIKKYQGRVRELRGDALLAEFERPSDAVIATLAFQADHASYIEQLSDDIRPTVRVGIAMGEVIIADNTVTGAGVVLAQRVEQLSEPGSVCISAAIHEGLPMRLPFDQADMGERPVKGFDEPIRIYRVGLKPGQALPQPDPSGYSEPSPFKRNSIIATVAIALIVVGGSILWLQPRSPEEEPALIERMAFPLPGKPSIAVLPFVNMSDDAQQEYFVDGMTEDLITDLSRLSGLFVIARNSVFTYKNKPVKVKQVAEEFGVRYVLEGSVRRVGDQVRINAQLIDTTTGGHLWAERYDGSLANVFALQDSVTRKIVTALAINLTEAEQTQTTQNQTDHPEAYDAFLQGWQHYLRQTPEDFVIAIPYFETAVALDPNYGRAYAALAAIGYFANVKGWRTDLGFSNRGAEILRFTYGNLEKAMVNPTALAHTVASNMDVHNGRHADAVATADRAIALEPNNPVGYMAIARALVFSGDPEKAIEFIDQAIRLNPHYPPSYLWALGMAKFGMDEFEDAVIFFERARKRSPDLVWVELAAVYGYLDRKEDARNVLEVLKTKELKMYPGQPLMIRTATSWYSFKNPGDKERFVVGLRKAGLR